MYGLTFALRLTSIMVQMLGPSAVRPVEVPGSPHQPQGGHKGSMRNPLCCWSFSVSGVILELIAGVMAFDRDCGDVVLEPESS